jgi:photosystem II stability/assembly factor-like uncharacterized protein
MDPRPPYVLTTPATPDFSSSVHSPGGARSVLYRSDDAGTTWRSLGDAAHSPSDVRLTAIAADPQTEGAVVVGTETGEVWRVTADARWTRLCADLPPVQALIALS